MHIQYVSGSEKTDLIVHDGMLYNSRHECTIIIHRASFIIQHVSYMNALLNSLKMLLATKPSGEPYKKVCGLKPIG